MSGIWALSCHFRRELTPFSPTGGMSGCCKNPAEPIAEILGGNNLFPPPSLLWRGSAPFPMTGEPLSCLSISNGGDTPSGGRTIHSTEHSNAYGFRVFNHHSLTHDSHALRLAPLTRTHAHTTRQCCVLW